MLHVAKISKRSDIRVIGKECQIMCIMLFSFQWIYGQDSPAEFSFNQSTLQAFYFFNTVTINAVVIESNDWVAAFNGDVCVGARQWDVSNCGGGVCDIPAMGDDGSSLTSGYMQPGEVPSFKVFSSSSNTIFNVLPSYVIDPWSINNFVLNDRLDVMWSVNEPDYQYNGSVTASLDSNDLLVGMNDMIAAIVGYEIRGIGSPEIFPLTNEWVFPVMIHSNVASGELIEFIYYASSSEQFLKLNESYEFTSDMVVGNAEVPFIFTLDYCSGEVDDCGICDSDNSSCSDCAGVPNGGAILDECNVCDNDSTNDCVQDCAGTWGGILIEDECSVCGGNNSTCTDCNEVVNGGSFIDGCGNCVAGNTFEEACSQDCNGEDGGTAWINSCNECVAEGDSSCIQGCDGNWSNNGSQLLNDSCDVCDGDGLSCLDLDIHTINNFSMSNVYPNPFNPMVNIDFIFDSVTYLDLSIYSVQGNKIGNLFDGFVPQGISSFIWEPQHVASGLYLITAILNGRIETKKVLFQK